MRVRGCASDALKVPVRVCVCLWAPQGGSVASASAPAAAAAALWTGSNLEQTK